MRARQRHFNPVHAGANTSVDGRFISGLANNALMSSWTGRAGSSLTPTQATLANQPVYRTSAINGQPGAYFDDGDLNANGPFFEATTSVTSNAVSCIMVGQKTAEVFTSQYARLSSIYNSGNNPFGQGDYGLANSMVFALLGHVSLNGINPNVTAYRGGPVATSSYTTGDAVVVSSILDGATITVAKNGVPASGATSESSLNSDRWLIGAAPSLYDSTMRGYISRVDFFITAIGAPLRRRCEQSAAYSFKIACS